MFVFFVCVFYIKAGTVCLCVFTCVFLSDPGVPGPIFVSGCHKQTNRPCVDLTDVTMADEDCNSMRTDNANRAIQGDEAMHNGASP